MNPILLSLTDGTSFFAGLMIAAMGVALLAVFSKRIVRSALTILVLLGIVLVLISATPLPLWLYVVWTIATLGAMVAVGRRCASRRSRLWAASSAVALSVALSLVELPHHCLPTPVAAGGRTVYVVGDSLSAGAGSSSHVRLWPSVLADREKIRVVNLAQPGATVGSAMKQLDGITTPGSVVVVEIGGNDLLGGTAAADFRDRLDALLTRLSAEGHTIVMFELPLLPLQNSIGRAQRELAAKHGVALIPKRFFTKVLAIRGGTIDGLHFSQEGHDAMAALVSRIVTP